MFRDQINAALPMIEGAWLFPAGMSFAGLCLYIYANFERWWPWAMLLRDREKFHALIPRIEAASRLHAECGYDFGKASSMEILDAFALVEGGLHELGIRRTPAGASGWAALLYCAQRRDIRRARRLDFPSLDS